MNWNIILFESNRNDKPVEEFIKSLQTQTQAKIIHNINLLETYGSNLSMPHSKPLNNKLFELRIRGKEEIRIIYAFLKKDIYLLHAFKKKAQKTLQREINLSLVRLKTLT